MTPQEFMAQVAEHAAAYGLAVDAPVSDGWGGLDVAVATDYRVHAGGPSDGPHAGQVTTASVDYRGAEREHLGSGWLLGPAYAVAIIVGHLSRPTLPVYPAHPTARGVYLGRKERWWYDADLWFDPQARCFVVVESPTHVEQCPLDVEMPAGGKRCDHTWHCYGLSHEDGMFAEAYRRAARRGLVADARG